MPKSLMNVAVDAFPLTARSFSGIPNYVKNTLTNLIRLDSKNEYFLYCKNPFQFTQAENLRMRFSPKATEASTSYGNTIWLFSKGVWMMKKDHIDVFWGTRQMLPFYLPKRIKTVLTMHDLVWRYFPETMELYGHVVLRLVAERSIKAADHIIAVSHSTARSLVELFEVPEKKISVIHLAADQYVSLDKNDSAEYISEKYGTNREYVLTVSTIEPRKNLKTLLRVFSRLKPEGIQLLVAGASGWKTSSIHQEYERLGLTDKEVKFLGYVPDEDMNRLYSGARLFVFPAIYEGFGMPPLEAMASGTAVISSNSSSLPEVVGDAGMLLDPRDAEAWAEAISKVMSEPSVGAGMRAKALERARMFSWEKAARETLEVFDKVLE